MVENVMTQTELKYAQFGKRATSVIIELILGISIYSVVSKIFQSDSKIIAMFSQVVLYLGEIAYVVFFHWKWGQTIGKMITRIKVVKVDGSRIGYKEAFLRSSVDIVLNLISLIIAIIGIAAVSQTTWAQLTKVEMAKIISPNTGISGLIFILIIVWILSEAFTVLFNKRRRAIHDYIAGTVVIDLTQMTPKESISAIHKRYTKVRTVFFVFLALTVFPSIASYGILSITSGTSRTMLSMTPEKKEKLIQSEEYYKLKITTMADFDNFYEKSSKKPFLNLFNILFTACFFMAGFYFKKWGYIALSVYAVLATLISFSVITGQTLHFYPSKPLAVYCFLVNFTLCCYLFSKSIRRLYFPKDELPKILIK